MNKCLQSKVTPRCVEQAGPENDGVRWHVSDQRPNCGNGCRMKPVQSCFAQRHDMPWLYALAASTAFGRVQQREHWASDTVAGAFMGYAIGSMLTDQSRSKNGVRLSVTPQAVVAHWSFR